METRPTRVLLLTNELGGVNGAVAHTEDLAVTLAERGYEVVLGAGGENEAISTPGRDAGREGGRLDVVVSGRPAGNVGEDEHPEWVAELVAEVQPDVVHTHMVVSIVAAARALSKEEGRPALVATLHSHGIGLTETELDVLHETLQTYEQVIAVSEALATYARAHTAVPVEVIAPYSRVPTPTPRPGHLPEGPLVGFVGRLHPVKGVTTLLSAMEGLPREVHLGIVGDGPLREEVRRRAEEGPLRGRVHLLGWQPRSAGVMGWFDAVAAPSWSEGHPLVVREALWVGVPVVTTPVGQVEAMLSAAGTGELVPPGEPGLLAAALSRALAGTHPAPVREDLEGQVLAVEETYLAALSGAEQVAGLHPGETSAP